MKNSNAINDYRSLQFFKDFEEKNVKKLLDLGSIREFQVKEYIIDENQELRDLFVLLKGAVHIGITVPNKGKIQVGTIHPGNIFSWSAMFSPFISTAYAVAYLPSRVLSMDAKKVQTMIDKDSLFGYQLMRFISETLSRRLHDTRFQLVNIATL